jgi:nitroreductase
MPDCKTTILTRRSVRSFLPTPLPPEVLADILEAGRVAPSTQNRQPWRFIVIQDAEQIKQLALHCGLIGLANYFIRQAPCLIIACADPDQDIRINGQDYYLVDTAIAFQQMMLMAWHYGVGSCWLGAFSEKKLKAWLELAPQWRIVALSPFGYPSPTPGLYARMVKTLARSKDRLPLAQTVRILS